MQQSQSQDNANPVSEAIKHIFSRKRRVRKQTGVLTIKKQIKIFLIKKFKATSKSNENDFPLFLCQHKDSFGLVHCNSNLPAVMQGDVCD